MRPVARLLIWIAAGLPCPGAGCVSVATGVIQASDMTSVLPAFASLDPETPLAAAPVPGVRRVVGPQEIRLWARRAGLELDQSLPVCFQRDEIPLEAARVESTIAQALTTVFGPDHELSWKVISYRPLAVPPGDLLFLRGGLTKSASGVHLWRGRLRYDEGRHSLPVVITLRLTRRLAIAKAGVDLNAGTRLEDAQTVRAEIEESPLDGAAFADPARLAGRTLRRAVPAGQALVQRDLVPVYAVERGSSVTAEASVGGARVAVPAVAQTSAPKGQRVLLRNPETRKTFAGRVLGKGRVEVETGYGPQTGPGRKP